jgi:regulator of protease activity HflC (stomatin/prohibitin superfamily)
MFTRSLAPLLVLLTVICSGCIAVIRQGEVGVRNRWGQFDSSPLTPGVELYNPFSTDIERVTTRTVNVEVRVQLPSKEGLSIETEVSILYHVEPKAAPTVLGTIGDDEVQVRYDEEARGEAVGDREEASDQEEEKAGSDDQEGVKETKLMSRSRHGVPYRQA